MPQPSQTVKQLYEQAVPRRDSFLRRARRASELTIPSLIPPEGHTDSLELPTPYQSIGSQGVKNLASKLLLALLPPNSPFFRLLIDRYELKNASADEELVSKLDAALREVEKAVQEEIETSGVRTAIFEAILHLVVGGNILLYVPRSGQGLQVIPLSNYVVKRDPTGNVLHVVVKEEIGYAALPEEVQEFYRSTLDKEPKEDAVVCVYTLIKRTSQRWSIHQEIEGRKVPGSSGQYPLDRNPWIPLRFSTVAGEDYGRGLVEECLGDLSSLEGLSMAVLQASAAASKVVFMVHPGGSTNWRQLVNAPNLGFVQGSAEDVDTLQTEKYYDLQTAEKQIDRLERRLQQQFLLLGGVQRQAERVTAEEIRVLVQELETTLGGIYSLLGQELQLPLCSAFMSRMQRARRLPALPKGIVKTVVVTGVDALGRGNDLAKLDQLIAGVAQMFGPEVVAQRVSPGEYFLRRATALGIDITNLIKTDEQLAEEAQQAQQQALLEKTAPELVRQGGQLLQSQQQQQQAPA